MSTRLAKNWVATVCILGAMSAHSQAPKPYGASISLENAKKVAAVAVNEASKNNWTMDTGGNLVYYEKMDNTQIGSANSSVAKARSAVLFKRPTKAFQDRLTSGDAGLAILRVEGAVPIEGGIPLLVDGKIVGAIGVSGDSSENDGQCAKAAADVLK
jgi:glc operon protein GlcG